MQSCVGTKFPEEGYSFCLEDGSIPGWDVSHGFEPYIDIAGEYYAKPKTNADRIRAMSDEELAKFIGHNSLCNQIQNDNGAWCEEQSVCEGCLVEWLKQPAEEDHHA
jgi:hypothetical protein